MSKLSSFLFGCGHEFGWPRKDESGLCYQQCLKCGAEYSFDWNRMRRGEKLAHNAAQRIATKKAPSKSAATWQPRERRISWQAEIQYRLFHADEWLEGLVENISRSGVMFRSDIKFERGASISMVMEMPEQITGSNESRVFCTGEVARCLSAPHGYLVAVKIRDYRFLYSPIPREEKRSVVVQ